MAITHTVLDQEAALREIIEAFRRAEAALREEVEDAVHVILSSRGRRARQEQARGVLARVALIRTELEGQAALFADDTMARVYADGMDRADRALAAAGASTGAASFTTVHLEALAVMAADAYDDLAAATDFLDTAVKRSLREAAKVQTQLGAATGAGVPSDTRALVRRLSDSGVTGFVDASGRGWRVRSYAEMVVRTKSAQAYNTGTVLRAEEEGTDVFEIRDGERSGHAECLQYSGQTCSGAWALANPVEHPNCVRAFGPLPLHTGRPQHT